VRSFSLILLALAFFAACGVGSAPEFAADEAAKLEVTRGEFKDQLLLSGELRASDSVSINSPPEGWGLSIRWLAEDGATVKKGDKVLEMDTTAIVSQLDAADAAYIKAASELAQQQNNASINLADKKHLLRQAEIALEKAQLNADVPADAYPRRVYEDMQLALKRAQSAHTTAAEAARSEKKISAFAVEQARIALAKARREIEGLDEKIKDYIISAPKDGILIRARNWREGRGYEVGDKTWPGQPILEMPNLSVMVVKARLSDVDDGRVHVGMATRATLDAFPDRVFSGHVTSISPVANAPTYQSLRRAFEVEIELDETDPAIMRPGMSVQVELADQTLPDVLLAPRAGLLFEGDAVFALFPGGHRQAVTVSRCSALVCVVDSGLKENTLLQSRATR
jgi:multidrug efflux pump subunit AcrA (membrane-fusion protein)